MTHFKASFTTSFIAGLLLCATAVPCAAASSAASSASDSVTTSVGSVSASITRSSTSSSQTAGVAEGDYRIIDVDRVAERPGMARMTLQALAQARTGEDGDGTWFLDLPQAVVEQYRLAQGGIVTALQRAYGIEFAQGQAPQARQAFFLVLSDDWYRELHTQAVAL